MAIKKYKLQKKEDGGTSNTIYLETSSDVVVHDNSTVKAELTSMKSTLGGKAESSALSSYVPTGRTVNTKPLTGDVELTPSDLKAAAKSHKHNMSEVSGVLSVARGGIGCTSLEELKEKLEALK